MPTYYYTLELYHHGIKGQRWGVRRFQNKDGSLTPAGKKRYDDPDKPKKQTRYDKLYSKYKTLGYSDEKAAKEAKGRVAAERSLMVIGGVAVAATAAYAGYRYWDNTKDRFISPDKVMQTVHMGDASERLKPGNPFFATYGKKDNTIYASKVFSHFTDQSNVTRFYTKDGIKVASESTGRKIFNDLVDSNPEVAEYSKRMGHFKNGKKAYQRFNYSLVLRNDSETAKKMGVADLDHDKIHNIFYDELRKRGYGAVIDTNDSKKEGFTFNPVIVFDNQIKHIVGTTKATKEHLSPEQTLKGLRYARQRKTSLNPLNSPIVVAEGIAFASALNIERDKNRRLNNQVKFVEQYLKEHPNTKLTNAQIAKMYES